MCAKYFVPVTEVRCKVCIGFLMVHVMFARPSVDAKWYQTRCGPGEIIAAVIFYRNIHMQHHEGPCSEQVTSQDHRIQGGPEAHCNQLPATKTLSRKSKGRRVIVMDGVEGDIQPADPVMEQVPNVLQKYCKSKSRRLPIAPAISSSRNGAWSGRSAGGLHAHWATDAGSTRNTWLYKVTPAQCSNAEAVGRRLGCILNC